MQAFLDVISEMTLSKDASRIFHGRGGFYPECEHLSLDWFSPVLLLTSFKPLSDESLTMIVSMIKQRWSQLQSDSLNLVYQHRSGIKTQTKVIEGQIPDEHVITENDMQFYVHLLRGQNHGLFLDMSNGRKWVKSNASNKKVLNLFAYTCAFSVAALQGKAEKVVNIDMSKGALSIGKHNHRLNHINRNASFLSHDIFKSWGKLKKNGPYDMIIADPPSNQKGSFVASKDYARLLKRLPELMSEKCDVLLCLNAPELNENYLKQQVSELVPDLHFVRRIANPDAFKDVDMDKALKVLHYQKIESITKVVTK